MQKIKTIIQSFVYALIFVVGIGYAVAWTGPQNTPPNCVSGQPGCDAPINVSSVLQAKAGALHLGSSNPAVSFRTLAGQSAFGTAASIPATLRALFSGNVGAAKYCDEAGNNCYTSNEMYQNGSTGGGSTSAIPTGAIVAFASTSCPSGWTAATGGTRPDLRGRNIIGAYSAYPAFSVGGAASVKLSTANLAPHEHLINGKIVHNSGQNIGKTTGNDDTRGAMNSEPQIYDANGTLIVQANGAGQTNVAVMDPYVALLYCQKD